MKNFLTKDINAESLNTLFAQAPIALAMLTGDDLVVESANPQILELWRKDHRVVGLPILEALPELASQAFPDLLRKVYTTGIPYRGTKELVKLEKDGVLEDYYFDFVYSAIVNMEGKITGVSVIGVEVTEQVLNEKRLRESELRYKELIEVSDFPTAIYLGKDLIIVMANDQMIKTWGKDRSVIGKRLEDALPELEGQPFIGILKDIFKTGETYIATEDRVDLVVGGRLQTFYYNFSYKPLRNSDGEIYAIMNVAVDVTETITAKKNFQENELKYKNLAEAMPQLVWTAEPDGKIDFTNTNITDFFGLSHEEIITLGLLDFIHPDDVENVRREWQRCSGTKTLMNLEARLHSKKTNQYNCYDVRCKPILDEDHQIIKWICTANDISEFKTLSQQKDTFLGIASHELKTPLTSLKLYSQVLERMLEKTGDAKNAELARKMDAQVVKLTSLIGDLLDVTKINAGKIQLNEQHFDFDSLVRETIEDQQLSTKHKIELHSKPVGTIFADRERIGQVITNLISNAIKYSPDQEKIVVTVSQKDGHVQLCVQDFGIGMPEEKKDRVFEQYYRVSGDEETTFPGLGLGLYIASEIIERSEGKIWVNSILDKGSTFCFSLPISKN